LIELFLKLCRNLPLITTFYNCPVLRILLEGPFNSPITDEFLSVCLWSFSHDYTQEALSILVDLSKLDPDDSYYCVIRRGWQKPQWEPYCAALAHTVSGSAHACHGGIRTDRSPLAGTREHHTSTGFGGLVLVELAHRQPAGSEDLVQGCRNVVQCPHALNIVQGDLNRYNFLVTLDGTVTAIDFELYSSAEQKDLELATLFSELSEETSRGTGTPVFSIKDE
ncbi:hypothetical protein K503DRAFT_788158, partial [Rhizopogon vinicolor AM-OR11-026]